MANVVIVKSFRLRLALMTTLVSGAILFAFVVAAWLLIHRTLLSAVDAQIVLPAKSFVQRVHPQMNLEEFRKSVSVFIEEGTDSASKDTLGLGVLMRNRTKEMSFQSSDESWIEEIPFADFLPNAEELKRMKYLEAKDREARRRPPSREGKRRPPPDARGPRDRRGPPPPPGRRGGSEERSVHRKPVFFSAKAGGETWRIGAFSNTYATVFAGVNMRQFDADVRKMRLYFFIGLPIGLLLTAGTGWLVSGKATRAVRRITETAEHMTAQELDQRIPITGHEDEEFARLVKVLNHMMERLERSFHQSARFSADASHELKTPLAVMQGELETALRQCVPDSPQEQTLLDLSEEVHRLKKITENLLVLSRADSGSLNLDKERFSLSEMMHASVEDSEILCEEEKLAFSHDIEADVHILADRVLVQSIVHNLVSNAIKYNREDGSVRVALCNDEEGNANIVVENTGSIIPEPLREKIFDRFFRADDSRTHEVEGFGLGLNIAAELARANGGILELVQSENDLTRFALRFPKTP